MKIEPSDGKILVKKIQKENKTAGGLFLPLSAKNEPDQFLVLDRAYYKTRKDGTRVPFNCNVGDRVLLEKYAAMPINFGDDEVYIVPDDCVLGILKEGL